MGDKQNDTVIFNTKNNKENMNRHIQNTYMQIHYTHIYLTYVLNKYRARKSFITFILYKEGRFYNICFILPSILTNIETY